MSETRNVSATPSDLAASPAPDEGTDVATTASINARETIAAVETPASEPRGHDPFAAIREPNYRAFAMGFVCSSTGLQMMNMALAWDVYERTHDPLKLGYLGLARALPVLLLALPAGQIIDLVNRRFVLMMTQLAFAACALVLTFATIGGLSISLVYAIVALSGCARVFNGPSRATLLPLLVPKETFHNAVTWNSGAFQFSAVAGPILAGTVIDVMARRGAAAPAWPVYALTALGCIVFALSSLFLTPRAAERASDARFTIRSMLDGARHLYREKTILATISLDLFAVLLGGATILMPVYAKDILHVGSTGLGMLKSAPYIGALLMAFILAYRPPFVRAGRTMLLSVAGFGVCTIIFGLSTNIYLSLAALLTLGALDNISVVIRHVLVQVRTPDHLRGRVSSVNSVFIESSNELGAFESGLVAELFGPLVSVVSGGIGTIAVVLGIAIIWPQVRRLGKLEEIEAAPGGAGK
jgi:MFS family permease